MKPVANDGKTNFSNVSIFEKKTVSDIENVCFAVTSKNLV